MTDQIESQRLKDAAYAAARAAREAALEADAAREAALEADAAREAEAAWETAWEAAWKTWKACAAERKAAGKK